MKDPEQQQLIETGIIVRVYFNRSTGRVYALESKYIVLPVEPDVVVRVFWSSSDTEPSYRWKEQGGWPNIVISSIYDLTFGANRV